MSPSARPASDSPGRGGELADRVIVVSGGDPPPRAVLAALPHDAFVIAADSGAAHAVALGLPVHEVVGDLDSIDPRLLDELERSGTEVERHPRAKDRTDLEIALDRATSRGPSEVIVVGGHGGRLDHQLGNLLLLASPSLSGLRVTAHVGSSTIHVVRDRVGWRGSTGDLVTLFALHGMAGGVRTEGLLYRLEGETLLPGSTRGVSNELVAHSAAVSVESGVVLVVHPLTTV